MPVDGVSTVGYRQRASTFGSRSGFTGNGRSKYKSPPPAYVRFGKANVRYTGAGRGPLSYYFYHYIHAIQNTTVASLVKVPRFQISENTSRSTCLSTAIQNLMKPAATSYLKSDFLYLPMLPSFVRDLRLHRLQNGFARHQLASAPDVY